MRNNNKKQYEKNAVICFLKNQGINCNKLKLKIDFPEKSIIDIREENLNFDFQVKCFPREAEEVDGRINKEKKVILSHITGERKNTGDWFSHRYTYEESWEMFVVDPLNHVIKIYGENPIAAKNIIFLIYIRMLILPVDAFLREWARDDEKMLFLKTIGTKSGFSKIYLVGENNVMLYPKFSF